MMDETIKSILDKLVNEWAPAVLELGVRMTWYNGLVNIIEGAICTAFAIVLLYMGIVRLRRGIQFIVLYQKSQDATYPSRNEYDNVAEYRSAEAEYKEIQKQGQDAKCYYDTAIGVGTLLTAIGAIFALVALISSKLFYIWNWIALIDPKTALAHDIYTKLVK